MRLPRLTTRRLIVVVAVVALCAAAGGEIVRLERLSRSYQHNAVLHRIAHINTQRRATNHKSMIQELRSVAKGDEAVIAREQLVSQALAAHAEYHQKLFQKYERAARYPWLAVSPDPPEPN